MSETSDWAPFLALLVLGFMLWYALLPLWMYNRVKGIERALWAVVSQLQALRHELPAPPASVASPRIEPPGPGEHRVVNSMFGR